MAFIFPTADTAVNKEEESTLNLTCVATGTPAPSITWSPGAGGKRTVAPGIVTEDREGLNTIESMLTISNLHRADAGNYACSASHSVMTRATKNITRVFSVTVNCKSLCVCVCVREREGRIGGVFNLSAFSQLQI